jgi:hypothetical protein
VTRRPPGPSSPAWLLILAAVVFVLAVYCYGKGFL